MSNDQANNIKFVKEVEKWPCLYNYELVEYSRKDITDLAWAEVGKKMKMSAISCKEKWKNLRTVFVRHMKPLLAAGARKRSRYYLTDAMQFIMPFVKTFNPPGHTANNSHQQEEHEEVDTNVFSPKTEIVEMEEEVDMPEQSPLIHCKVMKRECESANEEKFPEFFDDRRPSDVDTRKMFLLSLMDEVNQMSDEQMKLFKRKVLQLIDDITA